MARREVKREETVEDVASGISRDTFLPLVVYFVSTYYEPTSRAASKPYEDFESFYPFYLSQHENDTCRLLHFIGTTIFLGLCLYETSMLHCLVPAAALGMAVKNLTVELETGIVEMAVMVGLFLFNMNRRNKLPLAVYTLVIAYGFAWVGHFNFELNRPATFIYPLYSLFGDLKMWSELFPQYVHTIKAFNI